MPDDALRLSVVADIGEFKAAMGEAAGSVESASATMSTAMKAAAAQTETASFSMMEARHAATLFGEEIGVHIPRGVSTFLAGLSGVGPLMASAFNVFAVVGLAEILGTMAEKAYNLYENVVNLKSEFEALADIEEKVTHGSFGLSNEILNLDVRLAEVAGGPVAGAKAKLESLKSEVIDLTGTFETNGKKFSDLNASVQATIKSHMMFSAGDIKNQLGDVGAELKRLQNLQFQGDDALRAMHLDPKTIEEEKRAAEDLYNYLALLQQKYSKETELASAEVAKAQKQQDDKNQKDKERIARENAEGQRKLQEDLKKVKLPSSDEDLFAAMNQNMPKAAENWQKGLDEILNAQIKTDSAINVDVQKATNQKIEAIAKANEKVVQENEKSTEKMMHAWEKLSADINRPFTEAMDAVLQGTETASLAFRKMGSEIALNVVNALGQATLKALEFEAIAALIPGFGGGATAGSVFKGALGFEHGGVVPSFAHGGIVTEWEWPSAAGGAVVPIMAHAGEMVLPRDLSEGIQNAIRGGSLRGGDSGGDTHYHNHFHIGSVQGASAQELVKNLKTMVRRGELNFR